MFSAIFEWFKTMNWVDWVFVLSVLYGAIRGAIRGFSRELGVLIATLVALVMVRVGYGPLASLFPGGNPHVARLVSVVLIWVATMACVWMLGKSLGLVMEFRFKGPAERLGGLLTGALRQTAVFSVILLAAYSLVQVSWLQRSVYNNSRIGRALLPVLIDTYNAVAEDGDLPQSTGPDDLRVTPMPPGYGEVDYPLPPIVDD